MRSVLIALLLAGMAPAAFATVVTPVDLGELSRDARAIARGQVVAVDGRWTDDRRSIETIVTLEVETYLKGQFGTVLQFRVPGGVLGRYRNVVIGAPQFTVGDRIIVFLGATGPMVPYVLGLGQGVFRLVHGDGGEWLVSPSPIAPTDIGPVVRGSQHRVAAPLAQFEHDVRDLAAGAR